MNILLPRFGYIGQFTIENYFPFLSNQGLNTRLSVDFSGSPSMLVPTPTLSGQAATKGYVDSNLGGGASQTPLQGKSKSLANNSATSLFTFPLPSGQMESVHIKGNEITKKGADWAFAVFEYGGAVYNDGSMLQTIMGSAGDTVVNENTSNSGSVTISAATFTTNFLASLNAGVVTVTFNPGNVGTSPDSIVMTYTLLTPSNHTVTFL